MSRWKKIARNVVDGLELKGVVQVDKTGAFTAYPNALLALATPDEEILSTPGGQGFTPKQVRRWLWDRRRERVIGRDRFVVWGTYDEKTDKHYVGLADVTTAGAVERLNEARFRKVVAA